MVMTLIGVGAIVLVPDAANAAGSCGTSSNHTICVTTATSTLSGEATVTITNSPNTGVVLATWAPSGGSSSTLIQMFAPSPATNDYSFIWPTQKYLDRTGDLQVRAGSKKASAVAITLTLSNGNSSTIQRNPNDWASFSPGAWTGASDPVVPAVGDGPSNEARSDAVADRISSLAPPLFLFLGDVYENGTFTEFRNHYGVSTLDAPGGGTLWGATADVTQPTLGNHEAKNTDAFVDYWHGRPLFSSFTFGGVLFLDLNSSSSMAASSAQYQLAQGAIGTPGAPACIIAYWHKPAVLSNSSVSDAERAIWALLANGGADLLLVGHQHHMVEFRPLDAGFNAGTAGAHLVQLVSGAGGHAVSGVSNSPPGTRIAWSKGGTAGLVELTLEGAADGGTATAIGWEFQEPSGTVLRSGAVDCA